MNIFKHLAYLDFILLYILIVKFFYNATSYRHRQKVLDITRTEQAKKPSCQHITAIE